MKSRRISLTLASRALFSLIFVMIVSLGSSAFAQSNNSIFGPNVYVMSPSNSTASINSTLNTLAGYGEFDTRRAAVLFQPGTYSGVQSQVGFYEAISGLGSSPNSTAVTNGYLTVNTTDGNGNVTTNFWRSIENMSMSLPAGDNLDWGVSQGASFRRMTVNAELFLANPYCGYASGGFIADTVVNGQINSCSQQQWYTRNTNMSSWGGALWNMVFSGDNGGPAASNFGAGTNNYTVLAQTPVVREKPFLYVDGSGNYFVFSPSVRTNSVGPSWTNTSMGAGTSLPISTFYIATPSSAIADINAALASGKNLILTPGIYQYATAINVTNPNTVVLGMGYATLVPTAGNAVLNVADVDGVQIAGLLIDAGPTNSPILMEVGNPSQPGCGPSHASNPTSISDVNFSVGGATVGSVTTGLQIDSNNVIIDNMWSWRADHGATATGWTVNPGQNGIIINGNNVTALGLAAEHWEKNMVVWNGSAGETIFYQSEFPYDVPSQAAWTGPAYGGGGTENGYASYYVSPSALSHKAYGLGVYSFFNQGINIYSANSIEVPNYNTVSVTDAISVYLTGSGGISNVVDNTGGQVSSTNQKAYSVNFTGTNNPQAPVTCSVSVGPTAPGTPVFSNTSTTATTLNWTGSTDSSGASINYSVYRSTTAGSRGTVVGSATATTYTDTTLSSGTTYYYTVEAAASDGTAYSGQGSVTASSMSTVPAPPTNLAGSAISATQVNLTWTASTTSGVTYSVLRNGTVVASSLPGTSYSDSGLTASTSYTYTVEAVNTNGTSAASNAVTVTTTAVGSGWTLFWSDEFNGAAGTLPNPANWAYDIGGGGWGNSELETYCGPGSNASPCNSTTPNAYMDGNGNLVIKAIKTPSGTWTSARLHTSGSGNNFNFTYGRVEARMKLTVGNGFWPAFWMLGSDINTGTSWPTCGESDIMEWVDSYGPSSTSSTSHGPGYSGGNGIGARYTFPNGGRIDDASYHTYGLLWSQNLLQYYRDDPSNIFLTITPSSIPAGDQWVYNNPFFILLNFAVGGSWFPGPDSTTPPVGTMLVDYVRVYKQGTPTAPAPPTGLAGSAASSSQINLTWNASTTTGVTYSVARNGATVASNLNSTSYSDSGLTASTAYTYTVNAVNANGSAASNAVTISTQGQGMLPPAPPTGVTAMAASSSQINLAWTASTTSGVTYSVLRNGTMVANNLTGTSYSDTGLAASTTYTYVIDAMDAGGTTPSSSVSATTQPGTNNTDVLAINAGGAATGTFSADKDFTGGGTYSTNNIINVSGVANAAPTAVYQSEREGAFTYTLPGLTAGTAYTVRLHFAELYWSNAGQRVFNVSINGTKVLSNFDIVATAGSNNKAVVEQFTATANSAGQIVVTTSNGTTDQPAMSGIEVLGTVSAPPPSLAINAGGTATGSFVADEDFVGGGTYSVTNNINTTGVTNPAPMAVYQSARQGAFTYTLPGLVAGSTHTVRLHFAELYFTTAGHREFDVAINGTAVLTNFDIVGTAGAAYTAVVKQFTATANSSGQIVITFSNGAIDQPMLSGIEVQ